VVQTDFLFPLPSFLSGYEGGGRGKKKLPLGVFWVAEGERRKKGKKEALTSRASGTEEEGGWKEESDVSANVVKGKGKKRNRLRGALAGEE